MKRRLLAGAAAALVTVGGAWGMLFLYPRPADTTAPEVYAGDGSQLDYCELPELDGSGLTAADIPKAYSPPIVDGPCGWERWPMRVLEDCTEPLAEGVVDLRGLWRGRAGARDHVERIEQCGHRTVVTSSGIIHDFVTDGTLRNGSRDIEPPRCINTWAAIEWKDEVLEFRPLGLPFVAVTRQMKGEQLVWKYPGAEKLRMERICRVPETHLVGGRAGGWRARSDSSA